MESLCSFVTLCVSSSSGLGSGALPFPWVIPARAGNAHRRWTSPPWCHVGGCLTRRGDGKVPSWYLSLLTAGIKDVSLAEQKGNNVIFG